MTPNDTPEAKNASVSICVRDVQGIQEAKRQLDKARLALESKHEHLSRCHLDNMTYAKAEFNKAWQTERVCYQDFEEVYERIMSTSPAQIVFQKASSSPQSAEDDLDTTELGNLPRQMPSTIRAPSPTKNGKSSRNKLQPLVETDSGEDSANNHPLGRLPSNSFSMTHGPAAIRKRSMTRTSRNQQSRKRGRSN